MPQGEPFSNQLLKRGLLSIFPLWSGKGQKPNKDNILLFSSCLHFTLQLLTQRYGTYGKEERQFKHSFIQ